MAHPNTHKAVYRGPRADLQGKKAVVELVGAGRLYAQFEAEAKMGGTWWNFGEEDFEIEGDPLA